MITAIATLILLVGCEKPSSSSNLTVRTFDLSAGTFDKLEWPADATNDIWAIYRPGRVKVLLPTSLELSGEPRLIQFVKYPGGWQFLYTTESETFTNAFNRAIDYCTQFNVPVDALEQWKAQGGGNGSQGKGSTGRKITDAFDIAVTISSGSPKFDVTLIFEGTLPRKSLQ